MPVLRLPNTEEQLACPTPLPTKPDGRALPSCCCVSSGLHTPGSSPSCLPWAHQAPPDAIPLMGSLCLQVPFGLVPSSHSVRCHLQTFEDPEQHSPLSLPLPFHFPSKHSSLLVRFVFLCMVWFQVPLGPCPGSYLGSDSREQESGRDKQQRREREKIQVFLSEAPQPPGLSELSVVQGKRGRSPRV